MQVVGSLCVAPNTIPDPECMVWVMATKAETKQDTNETDDTNEADACGISYPFTVAIRRRHGRSSSSPQVRPAPRVHSIYARPLSLGATGMPTSCAHHQHDTKRAPKGTRPKNQSGVGNKGSLPQATMGVVYIHAAFP